MIFGVILLVCSTSEKLVFKLIDLRFSTESFYCSESRQFFNVYACQKIVIEALVFTLM